MVREPPAAIEVEIQEAEAGERLDRVLSRRALGLSRAAVQSSMVIDRKSVV